jgi:hypothetical protein
MTPEQLAIKLAALKAVLMLMIGFGVGFSAGGALGLVWFVRRQRRRRLATRTTP